MRPWLVVPPMILTAVIGGCTADEDVADDPVRPSNVGAAVQECELAGRSAVASVEVTNGTGHEAAFDVHVVFTMEGQEEGSGVQRSGALDPGESELVEVTSDGDVTALDDCGLENVEEVDS